MANTQAVFKISKDAGEPLDITKELTVADIIRYTVPSGTFITGAPQSNTLTEGSDILLSPLATIAADTLSDPLTAADVLLFKEVSEAGASVYDYDDEPASYDQLFGNVRNSGGTNFPGGVFQPTVSGTYNFIQELGISGNQVWANLGTTSGGSQLINNNGLRLNDAREFSIQTVSLNAGQNYYITTQAGGSTGRSSMRVKIELRDYVRKAVFSGDVEMPTSMIIQTVVGNQNGNGLTANGVYRSNNSGALQNVGFANWTWRIKVTRFGNWIQQHYWNDTGNIAYRESFNGGANWTAWGN